MKVMQRFGLAFFAAFVLVVWLAGCGSAPSKRSSEEAGARAETQPQSGKVPGGRFEEPGELDKLLDARPLAMSVVKSAAPAASAAAPAALPGKGKFRIQLSAESDIDAAQVKKKEYEKLLGGTVDMLFDAPYYKLRWGSFETKQEAEDKILELSDLKIQAFVVKQ
jgi:hypothetical protein